MAPYSLLDIVIIMVIAAMLISIAFRLCRKLLRTIREAAGDHQIKKPPKGLQDIY